MNLTADGASKTITFIMDNAVPITIVSINLISNMIQSVFYTVDPLTITTTGSGIGAVTSFGVNLPAGNYKLAVLTTPGGYISINNTINVVLPSNLAVTTQTLSYNGGVVSIPSGNLSPSSYILVSGFKAMLTGQSGAVTNYKVPPFVTSKSQS
jgi:hypothetical protein